MRQADINRKMFHVGHYNVIAGRFKHALEPYMTGEVGNSGEEPLDSDTVIAMSVRSALVVLAVDFATRLQADNEDFDPIIFLDRCSPNPEMFPISELWSLAQEESDTDDNSGND